MSEHVTAVESAASSSAASIATKTAIVGGTGLGAPTVLPFMQSPILFSLSPGDICQLIATAWILWQVYSVLKAKMAAKKPEEKPKEKPRIQTMGGNGGDGPEEEVEKED